MSLPDMVEYDRSESDPREEEVTRVTDQAIRVVPAGWYEDPSDPAQVRWWNGIAWTDHTQSKPDLDAADDLEESFAGPAAVRSRTRIRPTATMESWIVAFTPVLLFAALFVGVWAWLYVEPTFLVAGIVLAFVYLVTVVVAILDRRKLARWGHTPPPFAAVLLTAPVYLLIRALKLPKSWGQLIGWAISAVLLLGGPAAAWGAGALTSVEIATKIQYEIRQELVGSGQASAVSCPPIADTMTVGSIYTCAVTRPDGGEGKLWVSIDSDHGDYSYSFAIR
ncbi:DUF2510 domain-containing protein [Protaetiibacter sp. SSC-01]|uniref:DUF2510 domain-containing protein n=1 Tax=Protaetiibacter sp. SSC-01 TaxID=2759943 RepID=UPI001656C4C3|nr:DUF2510 domain-containing protein [Protaetiibacter sp. SSC-01]QNO38604.1 DUF2510 domain-containing protein [Protaetiibacter sp. SSC-01]